MLTPAQQRALTGLAEDCRFNRTPRRIHHMTRKALFVRGMIEASGKISPHGKRYA